MSREPLDRRTYRSAYEAFREQVEERSEIGSPSLGDEVERAMLEFMDRDELASLEELLSPLFEATGRSRGASGKENSAPGRDADSTDTTVVRAHVDPEVDEAFEKYVAEKGMTYRDALAAALNGRMDGGRLAFLKERLEQIVPEAVDALDAIEDDVGGMTKSERVEISIAKELGDAFSEADLADAIDTVTSGTEYYHEEYTPRVIERKGVRRWETPPEEPDVFLPEDTWREKATGEILKKLGAEEVGGSGETLPTPVGIQDFLGAVSTVFGVDPGENKDTVNEYLERVEERTGCQYDEDAEEFVDPDADMDTDGASTSNGPETAATPDGPAGPDAERTAEITSDGGTPVDDRHLEDEAKDVDDEMDRIVNAHPEG